ncbi:transmembrane protein 165-like isoform X2 [Oppia nitens]|nr:transmembrane protein 165-like isoform X2 [Oppia nitens]
MRNYPVLAIIALIAIILLQCFTNSFGDVFIYILMNIWHTVMSSGLSQAFIASFVMILCTELGDKTFFITAIMAMNNTKWTVFMGSMTANITMNAISVLIGLMTQVIPKHLIKNFSIVLFAFFGCKMIYESYYTDSNQSQEELEEAENELKKLESKQEKSNYKSIISTLLPFVSFVFIETFCLIFFAEWGDKSQVGTIVLAAREDPIGVMLGSICGYSMCTMIAVLGGSILAQIISAKTVTLIGGISFISFALMALVIGS